MCLAIIHPDSVLQTFQQLMAQLIACTSCTVAAATVCHFISKKTGHKDQEVLLFSFSGIGHHQM